MTPPPDPLPDADTLRHLITELRRREAANPSRPPLRIGEFEVEGARVPVDRVDALQTLTRTEAAALRFLGWGRSNGDIGVLLGTNDSTVRTHLNNAVGKLEMDGVRQLNSLAGLLFFPVD